MDLSVLKKIKDDFLEKKISEGSIYNTNALISVILLFGIIVVINLISSKLFVRVDLTKDKVYTLSDSTKTILNGIDENIRIKAYFSSNLPAHLLSLRNQVKDIMEEYKAYSGGKIRIEFYDPKDSKEANEKAKRLGIPKVRISAIEEDKREVLSVYLGLAVMYENKKEIIRTVRDVRNIEYRITSAIKKVTTEKIPTIGFITNNGCKTTDNGLSSIVKKLKENFSVSDIAFTEGQKVPDRYDTVIAAGPVKAFSPRQVYELDQFLMRGKSIIFLLDSMKLRKDKLTAINLKTGMLARALSLYGVRLGKNLVIDNKCALARFGGKDSPSYALNYLYWPKITRGGFNVNSPVVNMLELLVLPWVRQVESEGKPEDGTYFTSIIKSSPKSWIVFPKYNLKPNQKYNIKPKNARRYGLGCIVRGKFKSFFAGKKIPEPNITNKERKEAFMFMDKDAPTTKETQNGRLAVIGSSEFVSDHFLKLFPGNGVFFQNLVEYMTSGDDLISIRSRKRASIPLPVLSNSEMFEIRWTNILCMPIFVIILGLMHFYFRKKEKSIYNDSVRSKKK